VAAEERLKRMAGRRRTECRLHASNDETHNESGSGQVTIQTFLLLFHVEHPIKIVNIIQKHPV
jgi:hypothetical protein